MTPEEKLAARRKIEIEYASKAERLNIVHQLLRAHALYETRRELRRAGRRGADRRRVHRPHDAGPSLVGGSAPGGRSQGRRPA